jgi:hypothetical protein
MYPEVSCSSRLLYSIYRLRDIMQSTIIHNLIFDGTPLSHMVIRV